MPESAIRLLGCFGTDLAKPGRDKPGVTPLQVAEVLYSVQVAFSEAELAELRRELQEQEQLIRGYQVERSSVMADTSLPAANFASFSPLCGLWKQDADFSACCLTVSLLIVPLGKMWLSIHAWGSHSLALSLQPELHQTAAPNSCRLHHNACRADSPNPVLLAQVCSCGTLCDKVARLIATAEGNHAVCA